MTLLAFSSWVAAVRNSASRELRRGRIGGAGGTVGWNVLGGVICCGTLGSDVPGDVMLCGTLGSGAVGINIDGLELEGFMVWLC